MRTVTVLEQTTLFQPLFPICKNENSSLPYRPSVRWNRCSIVWGTLSKLQQHLRFQCILCLWKWRLATNTTWVTEGGKREMLYQLAELPPSFHSLCHNCFPFSVLLFWVLSLGNCTPTVLLHVQFCSNSPYRTPSQGCSGSRPLSIKREVLMREREEILLLFVPK